MRAPMRLTPPETAQCPAIPASDRAGTFGRQGKVPMNQSEEDVLDMGVIASLRELGGDGDGGLFVELLDLYVDDSTKQMERLEQSLASGDLKIAERIAHTLKSSSANLGAMAMSKICLEMEMCGRKQSVEQMHALLGSTRDAHRRAIAALKALRG